MAQAQTCEVCEEEEESWYERVQREAKTTADAATEDIVMDATAAEDVAMEDAVAEGGVLV